MGCKTCGGKKVSAPTIPTTVVNKTVSSSGSTVKSEVTKVVNVNCGCGKSSCGCKTSSSSCGSYSLEACSDDPVKAIYNPKIVTCRSFNFPACNETANLYIDPALYDLANLPEGSYISNGGVGHLEVILYDAELGILTVRNNCDCEQVAEVGEAVASSTPFILSVNPCASSSTSTGSGDRTYLCSTFFIPALNSKVVVQIGRNGTPDNSEAFVGAIVRFQGYPFIVRALIDSDKIEIENTDAANPVNREINSGLNCSTVVASFGDTENICEKTPVASGKLIVCTGSSDLHPLQAPAANMFLKSDADGNYVHTSLGVEEVFCTELTADFTFDSYTTDYTVAVVDSSGFETTGPNSLLSINGTTWLVIAIPDSTHVRIRYTETPTGTVTYTEGSIVCINSCCACPHFAYPLVETNGALLNAPYDVSDVDTHDISSGDVVFTNPSNCQKATFYGWIFYGHPIRVKSGVILQMDFLVDSSLVATSLIDTESNGGTVFNNDAGAVSMVPFNFQLNPGETRTYNWAFRVRTTFNAAAAAGDAVVYNLTPAAPTAVWHGLVMGAGL